MPELFYITFRDSETGNKFSSLEKKRHRCFDQVVNLSKKYGFSKWRPEYSVGFGGISTCYFDQEPCMKTWRRLKSKMEYKPRLSTKLGKAVQNEFDQLETISFAQFNDCIGFDGGEYSCIGFSFTNTELFGFSLVDYWGAIIPEDCKEVTKIEYEFLFGQKSKP